MQPDQQLDVFRLLRNMSGHLENVRDDERVLRFCLRATRDFFQATDACLAQLRHGDTQADIVYEVPKASSPWDRALLTSFLRAQRPRIPFDHLVVPLWRRARWWGALCLRRQQGTFERGEGRLLQFVADHVSGILERTDQARISDARARLDRKISEQLQPRDLFYQILHLLRTLTRYDHSSALLMTTDGGASMQLVAEQIAWTKARSRRIGIKLPVPESLRGTLSDRAAYGFSRTVEGWHEWGGGDSRLASLLDGAALQDDGTAPSEATILSAPLVTRDQVIGIIKVAASRPGVLGEYELDLLHQFTPHASVATQYLQRIESLENRMLQAERKHAVANIARGVSHDVNNALGSVLPLVQQLRADAEANAIDAAVWAEDLRAIESAVQVCRRIFGSMLGFARPSDKLGQANLRRAIDATLAILRSSLDRSGIRSEIDVPDNLPGIRGGQGDLEQLFLNLVTNARDAMPDGGVLRIHASPTPGGVEVLVQDTGRGMPPEVLGRIYEPFFTTKDSGSGLGLTICRSLIWTMQGELTLESAPGAGTTARIHLGAIDAVIDARVGV